MFRGFPFWWSTRRPRSSPRNKGRLLTATPSEEGDEEKYGDSGGYQNPRANIFAGEADLGVQDVTQHCRGQNRRQEYT